MTAFNVVRFKVKPGNEQQFVDAHRKLRPVFKGFLGGSLIKTGDQTFCFVGEYPRACPDVNKLTWTSSDVMSSITEGKEKAVGFYRTALEAHLVETKGIEPSTFALRTRRSPS